MKSFVTTEKSSSLLNNFCVSRVANGQQTNDMMNKLAHGIFSCNCYCDRTKSDLVECDVKICPWVWKLNNEEAKDADNLITHAANHF